MRKANAFLIPLASSLLLVWSACSKPEEPLSPSFAEVPTCSNVTMTYLGPKTLVVSPNSTNNNASWHVNNNGSSAVTLTGQTLSKGGAVTAVKPNTWAPFPYSLAGGTKIDADLRFDVGASGLGTVGMTVSSSCGSIVAPAHTVSIQAGAAPTVTTNPASSIGTTTATLNGSANPNGASTTGWFRYSTTNPGTCNDTFGTRSPSTGGSALGSGTAAVAYSRSLTGLSAARTYYFCAIASNSLGTRFGTVRSLTTLGSGSGNGLRFGLWAMLSPGQGPGGDMSGPKFSVTIFSPDTSTVSQKIALADQHDVVLVLNLPRNRTRWAPGGVFNPATYESNVREFENNTVLRDAINRRRVLLFVVDEPNHSDFGGTISPTEVNAMGLLHKQIWPGALTLVRVAGSTLRDGWDDPQGQNQPRPAGGYTGLDYGWLQYSAQHTTQTFAQKYAEDRAILETLNMGMVPGLNWWGGGIGHRGESSLDGVAACWDIEHDGSSSGYIVGIDQSALPEGTHVDCGELPTAVSRTVASPAWIRRWADVVVGDADAPFAAMWRTADDGATIPGAEALAARSDYVGALDYAITKMASRTTWNGYRPAK